MVNMIEELAATTADQFAEGSKAFIEQLAATPNKAARVSLAVATEEKEMESLRAAARAAGFTLFTIRNSPRTTSADGQTVTRDLKLGAKMEVPQGVARPGRKKAEDAPADPSQPTA